MERKCLNCTYYVPLKKLCECWIGECRFFAMRNLPSSVSAFSSCLEFIAKEPKPKGRQMVL